MRHLNVIKANAFDAVKRAGEIVRNRTSRPHPSPVLIFGNQKSGTSAISMLLGLACGLRTQMDFRGAWEPHATPLFQGRTSIKDFIQQNRYAFSAPIVKEPNLTFVARRLAEHFPGSKGIFIVRNPYQNIRSILDRLDISGNLSGSLDPKTLPNQAWRAIMTGSDLGISGDFIEVQAHRWCRAMDEYEALADRFTLVRYEDFNKAKQAVIHDLAKGAGLDPVHDISSHTDVAFQRKGNAEVDLLTFFGTRNLESIGRICSDYLQRYGYEKLLASE